MLPRIKGALNEVLNNDHNGRQLIPGQLSKLTWFVCQLHILTTFVFPKYFTLRSNNTCSDISVKKEIDLLLALSQDSPSLHL